MLGHRVKPQWELGMVGPKINWRVCTLLKIPNWKKIIYITLAKQNIYGANLGLGSQFANMLVPPLFNPFPPAYCQNGIPNTFPYKASHNVTPHLFLRTPLSQPSTSIIENSLKRVMFLRTSILSYKRQCSTVERENSGMR